MTVAELTEGHERAWKQVYRWSSIARRLWSAGNFSPLTISANVGYRFYAHNLHRFYTCDWHLNVALPNPLAGLQSAAPEVRVDFPSPSGNRTVCG